MLQRKVPACPVLSKTTGKNASAKHVRPRTARAARIRAKANIPKPRTFKNMPARKSPPDSLYDASRMSFDTGMRCSLTCDQSQEAVTGASPVKYGTNPQSSQKGMGLPYLPTNPRAMTSNSDQTPQTNTAEHQLQESEMRLVGWIGMARASGRSPGVFSSGASDRYRIVRMPRPRYGVGRRKLAARGQNLCDLLMG